MAEHVDWLAEQIPSMCEICIGFRLCPADKAELFELVLPEFLLDGKEEDSLGILMVYCVRL